MKKLALLLCLLPAHAAAQSPFFHEEIVSLMERSPTFAQEVGPLISRIIVNTAESLPGDRLAILVPGDGAVATLYFDVGKLRSIRPSPEEVDIILVHEFFGHAVPQVRDGERCDDPARGQRYAQSCVAQRESVVLRELGMRPRTYYSLRGRR